MTEAKMAAPRMNTPIADSYWLLEGRLLAGQYPGHFDEPVARERLAAFLAAGIRSFIDLTERRDRLEPYGRILRAVAKEAGVEVAYERMPIRDLGVPREGLMPEILARIDAELAAGRPVYVHCWGGIGRTGTVAGCWLAWQGLTCDAALARITQLRSAIPSGGMNSPETEAQRDFVRAWAARPSRSM
jgi:hypothetical protein